VEVVVQEAVLQLERLVVLAAAAQVVQLMVAILA
jgi:hypothetical protein